MKLAERVSRLGTETAFAVYAQAAAYAAEGNKLNAFHIGDLNLATPDNIQEAAIRAMRDGKTGYWPNGGIMPLREALAAEVARTHGMSFTPENVAIQPGGKPVIEKFLLSLVNPATRCSIPAPVSPFMSRRSSFKAQRPSRTASCLARTTSC